MRTRLWIALLQRANTLTDGDITKAIIVFWCALMTVCILYTTVTQIGLALIGRAG